MTLSEQRREITAAQCRKSLPDFLSYAMLDERNKPWGELMDFQYEWCRLTEEEDRVNITGPKKWGKSSSVSVGRRIWLLGNDHLHMSKVVSANDDEAKKRGKAILLNIQHNEKVREVFPDLKIQGNDPAPSSFTVEGASLSGEPSVQCYGVFSSSTGGMADEIVFDDTVDMRNSILQPALREKVYDVVMENWLGMLLPDGKAQNISNAWHVADTTQKLKKNPEWVTWERPAVLATCEPCNRWVPYDPPEDGEIVPPLCEACGLPMVVQSLWPKKWSLERLQKRKRGMPTRTWKRLYMMQAASDEEAEFDREALEKACKTEKAPKFEEAVYAVGADLAIGKSKDAAYYVRLVGCIEKSGQKHLVAMYRKRGVRFHQQADKIVDGWQDFDARHIVVENNGYQEALVQELEKRSAAGEEGFEGRLPIKSYTTTEITARDLELGIPGLAGEVKRGEWTIWDSEGELLTLVEEAAPYPNGEWTDTVMAWMFVRHALRRYDTRRPRRGPSAPKSGKFTRTFGPRRGSPFSRPAGPGIQRPRL